MGRTHPLLALVHDPVMWVAERTVLGRFRSEMLGELRGDVLEIGAGTGLNFAHYPADARVLALEPDPAMLVRALKRAPRSRARVTLELGSDDRLGTLAAQSFDAVVLSLVLCTVEDPVKTLAGARRVLRPGGTLTVMEHVRSHGKLGQWQDRLRPLWERVAGGCQLNRETKQLIAEAGFDVTALRDERVSGGIVRDLLVGTATLG